MKNQEDEKSLREEFLNSQKVYDGKMISVKYDTVLLPNGKVAFREVVEHPGAVAVVPVTKSGKIVLVRQYRYPVGQVLWEIPAGKLSPKEDPDDCALRELAEETGFTAKTLKKLGSIFTGPGFTNEIIHLYLADKIAEGTQNLDEDEFLHVAMYTQKQVKKMVKTGEICDAKTIAGLTLAGMDNWEQ
ncbi:MAG: NUDIX hydrolase [Sporomusaceae bacterium]|jgi:ADP-ribose pyrophosphatase|nr:NUDIX hydrolase [Sporomusaceae bacterium]